MAHMRRTTASRRGRVRVIARKVVFSVAMADLYCLASWLLSSHVGSATARTASLPLTPPPASSASSPLRCAAQRRGDTATQTTAGGAPLTSPPRRSTFAELLSIFAAGQLCRGAPTPARADDETPARPDDDTVPPAVELVIDETNLMAPSTRKYLDKILRRLQEDTGLKLRVICPPAGIQGKREEFRTYLRPINKRLGIDLSSLVILAEQRVQTRSGQPLPLLSIQPGFRLQERFQYRLTQNYVIGTADKFGFPEYVEAKGTDVAIQETTENVVAMLYGLVNNTSMKYSFPLSSEEVSATLRSHGL